MLDLTYIFGNEIRVFAQPRQIDRQYVGLPGAHGLLSMHMGSRGRQIIVTGTMWGLAGSNEDPYIYGRLQCQAAIDAMELYLYADAADYTFMGDTYYNIVFDKIDLIPDGQGKAFHLTAENYVTCNFIAYLRQLI
jgi:hypothetical protein